MFEVVVLLVIAGVAVQGRPQDTGIHLVYSEAQSSAVPAPPEPRSGVAYVYSVPATQPPSPVTESPSPPEVLTSRGEAAAVDESEFIFKEVTVSKRVGFQKEETKDQVGAGSFHPLDPKGNES